MDILLIELSKLEIILNTPLNLEWGDEIIIKKERWKN
jgi:hypothetical protein